MSDIIKQNCSQTSETNASPPVLLRVSVPRSQSIVGVSALTGTFIESLAALSLE
jgi:hypothetical protein